MRLNGKAYPVETQKSFKNYYVHAKKILSAHLKKSGKSHALFSLFIRSAYANMPPQKLMPDDVGGCFFFGVLAVIAGGLGMAASLGASFPLAIAAVFIIGAAMAIYGGMILYHGAHLALNSMGGGNATLEVRSNQTDRVSATISMADLISKSGVRVPTDQVSKLTDLLSSKMTGVNSVIAGMSRPGGDSSGGGSGTM
jgi:hypothetical protein